MTCFSPVHAWRSSCTSSKTGKRPVYFKPILGGEHLLVPCGKCQGCSADKASAWSIRCYHESTLHDRNCFLTLTYDEEHNPGVLVKRHLQDFVRRLRDDGVTLRYFACGEYGEKTRRPHYHALVFGQDFRGGEEALSDSLYTSQYLARMWPNGFVSVGDFSMATACYVAGYVSKKIGDPDTFNLMSRRPGIGHGWLDLYLDDLVNTGSVTIEGKELPVPQRYLQWYESEFEALKAERSKRFSEMPLPQKERRFFGLPNKRLNHNARKALSKESI